MEKEVFVYVDLQGPPQLVGRLWVRTRGGPEKRRAGVLIPAKRAVETVIWR